MFVGDKIGEPKRRDILSYLVLLRFERWHVHQVFFAELAKLLLPRVPLLYERSPFVLGCRLVVLYEPLLRLNEASRLRHGIGAADFLSERVVLIHRFVVAQYH